MKKTISIEGMSCGHCSAAVDKALRGVQGVKDVHVDLEARQADVQLEGDVPDSALKDVITEAGYTVTGIH